MIDLTTTSPPTQNCPNSSCQRPVNLYTTRPRESRNSYTNIVPLSQVVDIPHVCLQNLFEKTATENPHRTALICGTETMTYGELDRRSSALALYLRNVCNVRPNELVGLLSTRSLELMVAEIAITKAGAAFLPLDPLYPKDRIEYIFADGGVRVCLCEGKYENQVPSRMELDDEDGSSTSTKSGNSENSTLQTVIIDEFPYGEWEEEKSSASRSSSSTGFKNSSFSTPADLAYTIYTSGSTGKPKGCLVTHKNAVNFVLSVAHEFLIEDIVQLFFSVSFDGAIWAKWCTLAVGAALRLDLAPEECSVILATSSFLQTIADQTAKARMICQGGEAMPEAIVRRCRERKQVVRNCYGPTECTVLALVSDSAATIGRFF